MYGAVDSQAEHSRYETAARHERNAGETILLIAVTMSEVEWNMTLLSRAVGHRWAIVSPLAQPPTRR